MVVFPRVQSSPRLDWRAWLAHRSEDDPILSSENLRYYASGRAALHRVVQGVGGGEVLVPALHCGVEVEAVLRAGLRVRFYDVERDLRVPEAGRILRAGTTALLVIHYFGFAQPMAALRAACHEAGVVLIEDCAHALYSRFPDGTWVGDEADYAIFSMRKTVFLPNGGAARTARGRACPTAGERVIDPTILTSTVHSLLEDASGERGIRAAASALRAFGRRTLSLVRPRRPNHSSPFRHYDVPILDYDRGISAAGRFLSQRIRWRDVIERRRENYLALADAIGSDPRVELLFPELGPSICPLVLPVLVRDRDAVAARMIARGVEPDLFGSQLHPFVEEERFPGAAFLSRRLLGLPVHQRLTGADVKRVRTALLEALP